MHLREALRSVARRIARAYDLVCAREERILHGLVVPTGIWACQVCRRVSFDQGSHLLHVAFAH